MSTYVLQQVVGVVALAFTSIPLGVVMWAIKSKGAQQ